MAIISIRNALFIMQTIELYVSMNHSVNWYSSILKLVTDDFTRYISLKPGLSYKSKYLLVTNFTVCGIIYLHYLTKVLMHFWWIKIAIYFLYSLFNLLNRFNIEKQYIPGWVIKILFYIYYKEKIFVKFLKTFLVKTNKF